jgi:hypothetical protein
VKIMFPPTPWYRSGTIVLYSHYISAFFFVLFLFSVVLLRPVAIDCSGFSDVDGIGHSRRSTNHLTTWLIQTGI